MPGLRLTAALLAALLAVTDGLCADAQPQEVVRMGIFNHVQPSPNEPVVNATVERIRLAIAPRRLVTRVLDMRDLENAISRREIDLFQGSAGLYRRMKDYGVRDLATLVRQGYPTPTETEASVFVVLDARKDLKRLADCRGKTVAANFRGSFTGWHVALGVIAEHGLDPETFFGSEIFVGGGAKTEGALLALQDGQADVAIVRNCYLEAFRRSHPDFPPLRVLERQPGSEPCARTSGLFPGWTLATTPGTDAEVCKAVTAAVLTMQPQEGGLRWSIATDFSKVDGLFKTLRIGPYQYLRQWTVKRFLEAFWPWILISLITVAGPILHGLRADYLVRRRTAQLEASHTAQLAAEKQARAASERFEALQRVGVISQLSAMFAHELRQPLSAITMYVLGLRKLAAQKKVPDPDRLAAILDEVSSQTGRIDAIVDKVRSYARSGHGPRTEVDLTECARSAVGRFAQSRYAGQAVRFEASEPVTVQADALELELTVLNLLRNSAQAQRTAGCADPIEVRVTREGSMACVRVRDHGGRMDDAAFARLSEPLKSSRPDGLGLGVAICSGILESHGGRLVFERTDWGLDARAWIPVHPNNANPGQEAAA